MKKVPDWEGKTRSEKILNCLGWYSQRQIDHEKEKLERSRQLRADLKKKHQKALNFLTWRQRQSIENGV